MIYEPKNRLIGGVVVCLSVLLGGGYYLWKKNIYKKQIHSLIEPLFNNALALSAAGKQDEALALYKEVLMHDPNCVLAYFNSGQIYARQQKWQEAYDCFSALFTIGYQGANEHIIRAAYAVALEQLGNNHEALDQLTQAIAADTTYASNYAQRGLLHQKMGNLDSAYADFSLASHLQPDYAKAFINLGNAYRDANNFAKALDCYEQVAINIPDYYASYLCMADIVHLQAKQEKNDQLVSTAMDLYKKAAQLDPTCYQAFHNLGFMHIELGKISDALAYFEKALALVDDPVIHFGKGACYLQLGDLAKGWQEYEWRFKGMLQHTHGAIPEWNGQDLHGKTLLLHAEQAFGDTFQFVRYAKVAKNNGARVVVEVHEPLKPIISLCPYIDQVIARGQKVPACDYQLPFMSAPRVCKTRLDSIPAQVPYLFADKNLVQHWQQKLSTVSELKIGICWECNVQHELTEYRNEQGSKFKVPSPKRSIPLALFKPLSQLPGVRLYSLQKYHTEQTQGVAGLKLYSFGNGVDEQAGAFMDTAAIMKNLDLVISVDTSLAHLAGGLGVKTWVLLPYVAEWRWLIDRTDSPWYPTMRLFRQSKMGDWEGVMEQVVKESRTILT